jgi:hypothetical protein
MREISKRWKEVVFELLKSPDTAEILKDSAMQGKLKPWTSAITALAVKSFQEMGYCASARGHRLDRLPVNRNEYLSLDVLALPKTGVRWCFPVAVVELENSAKDDLVAYALWKILCVRAEIRALFCYRNEDIKASTLVKYLRDEVLGAMPLEMRLALEGDLILIVGTRGQAETFPYGFFKWWCFDRGTATFELI